MKTTEELKKENSKRVQKCLKENYTQLRVSGRKEKIESWKEFAESNGMSVSALVNKMFSYAMEHGIDYLSEYDEDDANE